MFFSKRSLKLRWVGWCFVGLVVGVLNWLLTGCGGISFGPNREEPAPVTSFAGSDQNSSTAGSTESPNQIATQPETELQTHETFAPLFVPSRIYSYTNMPEGYTKARNPYATFVGQCTWYVFGRMQEPEVRLPSYLQDHKLLSKIFTGRAAEWDTQAEKLQGDESPVRNTQWEGLVLRVDKQRRAKSIAVYNYDGLSHVAFVEDNNGNQTESNYVLDDGSFRLLPAEVIFAKDTPIYSGDKTTKIGDAKEFYIMKATKREEKWYYLEPVDPPSAPRGWAQQVQIVPNIWNFTKIRRKPGPDWGKPTKEKFIHLNIPDIPIQSQPSNGATNVPDQPTLKWNAAKGAASYKVQVATDSRFSRLVIDQSGVRSTSVTVRLKTNTKYWWRVKAVNDDGESPWSSAPNYWSFTTLVVPPTPLEPRDGATNVSTTPTLRWNDSNDNKAKSYRVQVSTNPNFATIVFDRTVTTTSATVSPALETNTKYWWRVKAIGENSESSWSVVWSFTTRK